MSPVSDLKSKGCDPSGIPGNENGDTLYERGDLMFGLDVSVAMSYILSVLCTAFCLVYGILKTIKK
jgi:hypothetical protein